MPESWNSIVAVVVGLGLMAAAFVAVIAWAMRSLAYWGPDDD